MRFQLKPGGLEQSFGPLGCMEVHASTCAHCQRITSFPSMRVMQEHVDVCRSCMKLVCLQCAGQPCMPHEKFMEIQEKAYRRSEMFKAMGL